MIHVSLDRAASTVRVEWAPPQTPLAPIYPYRKSYFVDVDHPQREERARRRLHNLGFSSRKDLRGNVAEYQRQYGYPRITGELDDIERELIAFHDHHIEPPPKAPLPDDGTEGDYGRINHGVTAAGTPKQNGRQAHFNHIHAQLGPT